MPNPNPATKKEWPEVCDECGGSPCTCGASRDVVVQENGVKHVIKNVPYDAELTILSASRKHAIRSNPPRRGYTKCQICKCCSVVMGDCLGGCGYGIKHKFGTVAPKVS